MFNVVYIATIIVAIIIIFFVYSIIVQQKKVVAWQQARIAAEINTLEAERKRIAGDLHDELGPMLSAIKLQINHLEPEDETETAVLEKSSKQIDTIIQRFREISYDLLPNTLVRKGFIKATEEFVGKLKVLHALKIDFASEHFSLDAAKEVNLYRIIQEIIQNTIKHSRATFLNILIIKKAHTIFVQTKDDGVGFNYNEKSLEAKGVGLLSLQSRAQLLGGHLVVHTQPGTGVAFEIEIPI
jgi:two-component system, NarL family, sensor kinase